MEEIISVASGQHHTVVLKLDGTVLSWGENKFGQLGIDPNISNSFVPMEVYRDSNLATVYAGWTHSAALSKSGEVLTWGRNTYGQLGDQRDTPYKPDIVSSLKNVKQLSLGSEHNVAVTKEGKLYVWGWNEHGVCGSGDITNMLKPTHILRDKTVKLAFACTGSSFAVVE